MTQDVKTPREQLKESLSKFIGDANYNTLFDYTPSRNNNQNRIKSILESLLSSKQDIEDYFFNRCLYPHNVFRYFGVDVLESDPNQMKMLYSAESFIEAKRTYKMPRYISGKPAKMIKKVYPFLSESQCNAFAIAWKDDFVIDTTKFEVKTGKDVESFVTAYSGKEYKENPFPYSTNHGLNVKSLSCSCMRGVWDNLGSGIKSPAVAYASGDFKVYWVEIEGKVAARVVVREFGEGLANCGPIYTNLGQASDLLDKVLFETYSDLDYKTWTGAKLAKVNYQGEDDYFVVPYLDMIGAVVDSGDYLVIDNQDDAVSTSTNGYVYIQQPEMCDICGEYHSNDESHYVDGQDVCDSCLDQFYRCEAINGEITKLELLYSVMSCDYVSSYKVWVTQEHMQDYCVAVEGSNDVYLESCTIEIDGKIYARTKESGLLFRDYKRQWKLVAEKIETNLGEMSYWDLASLGEGCEVIDSGYDYFNIKPLEGFRHLSNGFYMSMKDIDSARTRLAAELGAINTINPDGSTNWAMRDLRDSLYSQYNQLQ